MTVYSYAQLESLWINAGGPRAEAPIAAAIGIAESGGNSDDVNPNDNGGRQSSYGIWQISNGTHTPPSPNWANPAENAKLAVAKWKAGWKGVAPSFGAWGTFTSGAYKQHLSNSTTPDPNVPGSPTAHTAETLAAGSADCLLANPVGASVGIGPFSVGGTLGPSCLFTRSNARAFIGASLLLNGAVVAVVGLVLVAAAAGMRLAGGVGGVAEKAGGALMLVPGAEGAGAVVAGAGRAVKNPAKAGQARGRRLAGEERQRQRELGEPRENPDLEVRGGTVRESREDTAARQRRQAGAARAAARRSAGQGRPASREEAGF